MAYFILGKSSLLTDERVDYLRNELRVIEINLRVIYNYYRPELSMLSRERISIWSQSISLRELPSNQRQELQKTTSIFCFRIQITAF